MIAKLEKAVEIMNDLLAKGKDHLGIFADKGWIDTKMDIEYSITCDGDGQNPIEYISQEVFKQLRKNKYIGPNVLKTFKARRFHAFKGTPGYDGPEQRTSLPE